MLSIELPICEDPRLQEVVAKVGTLAQMLVNLRVGCPVSLEYHLPILLTDDLVADATCGVNVLLSESCHVSDDRG